MDSAYKSRAFRENDLKRVVKLRSLVFGKDKAKTFEKNWEWYHRQNPVWRVYKPNSWVAEKGSEILGYISVIPGLMRINGKNTRFVWGGDLMSHPGHRGKGIGKEMVRRWKEEANICMALGVGDVAFGIEKSLGWFESDMAKAMVKILDSGKFLEYALKTKTAGYLSPALDLFLGIFCRTRKPAKREGCFVKEIKTFDSRFTKFWNEVSKNFNIAVIRNMEYLNWKYKKNPGRNFGIFAVEEKKTKEIKGYMVLTEIKSKNFRWGRIVDFVTGLSDKKTMQVLIGTAVSYFKKRKCHGIQVFGMKKEHRDVFRKNGFIYSRAMKHRFIVKIGSTKNLPGIDFFKNPKNWFITAGDSDFTV